jgi:hypothetical protein
MTAAGVFCGWCFEPNRLKPGRQTRGPQGTDRVVHGVTVAQVRSEVKKRKGWAERKIRDAEDRVLTNADGFA